MFFMIGNAYLYWSVKDASVAEIHCRPLVWARREGGWLVLVHYAERLNVYIKTYLHDHLFKIPVRALKFVGPVEL